MRILYVTTISGSMSFFVNTIRQLVEEGHTVEFACNTDNSTVNPAYAEMGVTTLHKTDCKRNPFSKSTLRTIKQIRKTVEEGHFDIVHCHTPVASLCTRLACRKLRKKGLKVVYTAHGFHFYKGAPKKNWLIYYPIEKLCARMTDVIITINKEDFEFAKKKFKKTRIEYIPGVGINIGKFRDVDVDVKKKREELGVPQNAFVVLSVGELNENKNQKVIVKAISTLENKENVCYVAAGKGDKKDELDALAKQLGVDLILPGHRRDVREIYKIADVFVLPSYREGLPVCVMEAMCSNIPVVASRIRGVVDLVNDSNGVLCAPDDVGAFAKAISRFRESDTVVDDSALLELLSSENVNKRIESVYKSLTE